MKNDKCIVLPVRGMHCPNCENKIEDALNGLSGIQRVKASYRKGQVEIGYDSDPPDLMVICQVLKELGYEAESNNRRQGQSAAASRPMSPFRLAQVAIVVVALYMIINATGGLNFLPEINQNMGYGLLFLTGLLVSLHCIGMCGGINLSQTLSHPVQSSKVRPSLLYNSGRVLSYTLLGGIVGVLGSVVGFSGTAKGIVAIVSGVLMILIGLNLLDLFSWVRRLMPSLPKSFSRLFHSKKGTGPFIVGLLNGFMPCGPLQAMQLYALGTGSFWGGASSMFVFSLGTVPLMFIFGLLGSLLSSRFTRKMLQASGILILVLGVVMFNRGMSLSGVSLLPDWLAETGYKAQIKGDVQVVTTELKSGQYTPITVYRGIPVRWTIKADQEDLNGCNNPVTIPSYHIEAKLKAGDNIIEFTPEKAGTIDYTCWMGMIRSTIKVIDP